MSFKKFWKWSKDLKQNIAIHVKKKSALKTPQKYHLSTGVSAGGYTKKKKKKILIFKLELLF